MIELNTENKLPKEVYYRAFTGLVLIILGFSSLIGLLTKSFSSVFGMFFLIAIVLLPIFLYLLAFLNKASFTINENSLTIVSGIIFRSINTIPFRNIQNIECATGPLLALFHIAELSFWTASSSQTVINNGKSENKPTGILTIKDKDALWLKNFIIEKQNSIK